VGDVPAYNSNGLWLQERPDALAAEAAELVGEGRFEGLKLRLGRDRLQDDLAVLRAVRDAIGEDVKLMVDFNQGLSFGDALHRCHALDDQRLYWFEEPTTYNNLDGYARLTRELKTPVQLGENFYGPRELLRALQAGAGDYVMPDLMRIGGISGWLRAIPIAAAVGIEVSTHLYPEVNAHLMRVTETAHWLEWQDWAYPVLAEPFGRVLVEAMLAGRPVVATDAGGVPEVVTDGETGVLVPPGDARALGEAIDALRRDPMRAAELARRGGVHARERFSRDAMLAGVRRVIDEAAA
jgi:mandelate racemase